MNDAVQALAGLKVVDLGYGMSAALVAQHLAAAGAQVTRVPPAGGDPFAEIYPAYGVWRRAATIEADATNARIADLVAGADICLIGGEDYPGVASRLTADQAQALSARLIVLAITGYPDDAGRPATEVLVQAASGLAFEHYTEQPFFMAFNPVTYGTALQGLVGVLAALVERERSGLGQVVAASLLGGALTYGGYLWMRAERPCPESENVIPKDPEPLILQCADGGWVHVVLGAAGSRAKAYRAFGLDATGIDPLSNGLAEPGSPPRDFFGPVDLFTEAAAKIPRAELLSRMWAEGVPADAVMNAGECWDEPQTVRNAVIETDAEGRRFLGLPASMSWTPPAPLPVRAAGAAPLSGVRVLDLGAFVAGPYGAGLLADLGAEVIKVETPQGDPNRMAYRSFASANRGKTSLVADMKSAEGRRTVHALAASADVVTSNFRNGVSQRLGVDPDSLRAAAPHLIILEAPAFGADGPKAMDPGFDAVIQAYCGLEARSGGPGNTPIYNRTTACDYTAGLLGAVAMLMALYHRARTGEGATICSPLFNAGLYLCSDVVQAPDGVFASQPALNAGQTGCHPAEAFYELADGWIALSVRGTAAAAALAATLGLKLAADPLAWGEAEAAAIATALKSERREEVLARLAAAGVWAEPCRQDAAADWIADPRLLAAGATWDAQHPRFGTVRQMGPQIRFSRSPLPPSRHAPALQPSTPAKEPA